MSFSFRNLFAQDQPPGGEPAADPPKSGGDSGNPFFSGAPASNPFSASNQEERSQEGRSGLPVSGGSSSTGRGSFEALFSGKDLGASPGRTATYSVREILPFLPPSLVSLDDLPLDKSVAVPLGEEGSTEVKLSVIQSVCPEIFATEITPLNDSEVVLPHREDNTSENVFSGAFAATNSGMAMGSGQRTSIFSKRTEKRAVESPSSSNPFSGGSNPFSAGEASAEGQAGGGNPFSAAVEPEAASTFVNPFSSAPPKSDEVKPSPTAEGEPEKVPVAPEPETSAIEGEREPREESRVESAPASAPVDGEESTQAAPAKSMFGFPEPKAEGNSFFGAFGSPPQPVAKPGQGSAASESNPFADSKGTSFGGGFSGDLPPFTKAKIDPVPEKPASVPEPEERSASMSVDEPAPKMPETDSSPSEESSFGQNPWETGPSATEDPFAADANPFDQVPMASPGKDEAPAMEAPSAESTLEDLLPSSIHPEEARETSPASKGGAAGLSGEGTSAPSSFDAFFSKTSGIPVTETSDEPVSLISSPFSPPAGETTVAPENEPIREEAVAGPQPKSDLAPEAAPSASTKFEPGSSVEASETVSDSMMGKEGASPDLVEPHEMRSGESEVPNEAPKAVEPLWSGSFPASIFGPAEKGKEKISKAQESPDQPGQDLQDSKRKSESKPIPEPKPETESRSEAPSAPKKAEVGSSPAASARERVVFSLRDVLLPMSGRTGLDFSNIPPSAKVRLPMSLIEPQLATGEVALRISDLARHTDPESALLLKRIDPLLVVPLPQNELFHQLQDMAPEMLPDSIDLADLEAEFSTLFASEAESDASLTWLSPTNLDPAFATGSFEGGREDGEDEVPGEAFSGEELEEGGAATPTEEIEVPKESPAEAEVPVGEMSTRSPEREEEREPFAEPELAESSETESEVDLPEAKAVHDRKESTIEVRVPANSSPKRIVSITRTSRPMATAPAGSDPQEAEKPSAPPKAPEAESKPAAKPMVSDSDPFASFSIPGPLSVGDPSASDSQPTSLNVDPFSSSHRPAEPKSPGSVSDPFAPLPRKRPEESTFVKQESEDPGGDENTFFDDLSDYAGSGKETPAPAKPAEEPEDLSIDASEPLPDPGFSGFAAFDDLEPFHSETTREWPASPRSSAPSSVPGPRSPESETATATEEASNEAPPKDGSFFEELEAETASRRSEPARAAASEARAEVAPEARSEEVRPAPAPTPTSPVSQRQAGSLRDIELRAIFGTNEEFTFRRVADLTAGLPGVEACAIVGPGVVVQAPRGREAGDLASRASSMAKSARDLAEATGMANSETFTFHTDRGVISIFTHGECCLTVSHAEGQFDPGVREKLILVARGLPALEN